MFQFRRSFVATLLGVAFVFSQGCSAGAPGLGAMPAPTVNWGAAQPAPPVPGAAENFRKSPEQIARENAAIKAAYDQRMAELKWQNTSAVNPYKTRADQDAQVARSHRYVRQAKEDYWRGTFSPVREAGRAAREVAITYRIFDGLFK